jgi:hypothetical protein
VEGGDNAMEERPKPLGLQHLGNPLQTHMVVSMKKFRLN